MRSLNMCLQFHLNSFLLYIAFLFAFSFSSPPHARTYTYSVCHTRIHGETVAESDISDFFLFFLLLLLLLLFSFFFRPIRYVSFGNNNFFFSSLIVLNVQHSTSNFVFGSSQLKHLCMRTFMYVCV